MGAIFESAAAKDDEFVMHTYARKPVLFTRGEGMRLYDDEGREYLDFLAAIGSVNLGHAHPAVADAVDAQMRRLVGVSNLFYTEHRAELAERLVTAYGEDAKVFFANSGAEANEGAIKLARRWGAAKNPNGCYRIVSAGNSFHGRTLATLAATGQAAKQDAFRPLPEGFDHVPLNDIGALEAAVGSQTCAVLLETIQGEGGVYPALPGYLADVRRLCDERGVLLIFDEVQTGVNRTGRFFGWQLSGVKPDMLTMAKSLANGLPIGAIVARDDVATAFQRGDHGSTFGGAPVICAAALATLDAHEREDLAGNAVRVGGYFKAALNQLAADTGAIEEVRGEGLMLGVTLGEGRAQDIAAAALGQGMVFNAIGTHILRFLPPLVCGTAEVDALLGVLHAILDEGPGCSTKEA
jgi:acetylornithine/N-succinyldiaminopimelate aminotransferase